MKFTSVAAAASLASMVSAHGLIASIQGANGVTMPGLSVIPGTVRDCTTKRCGAQQDSSIIRQNELGSANNKVKRARGAKPASALGRSLGGGPISAEAAVSSFLGLNGEQAVNGGAQQAAAQQNAGAQQRQGAQQQQNGQQNGNQRNQRQNGRNRNNNNNKKRSPARQSLNAKNAPNALATSSTPAPNMAGMGASSGLPTCDDNGVVNMVYHQVNGDGAGPLTAMIDSTSGGTDPNAFKPATMITDVPGRRGNSNARKQDFAISAQMPQGTVCQGTVAGVEGVCVMRFNNQAGAGPFGGSVAFQQSATNRKRAIEFNLRKRHFARGVTEKATEPVAKDDEAEDSECDDDEEDDE